MKGRLGFALKAGLSLAILAVIAAKTDLSRIAEILRSISAGAVAAAFALIILQSVVTAYRWVLVMGGVGIRVKLWPALQALYASLFINQCVPSYVGGDAYRVYWLCRQGGSLGAAARGVLIDRISALIALVVMMVVTLPRLFERFPDRAVENGMVLVAAAGVAGTVAFFACDALPRGWSRFAPIAQLAALSAAGRRVVLTGASAFLVGPLAFVVHALGAAIMFVFAADMGLSLTALDCLLLIPPIMLLSAIPISISGWGVREGVMIGALAMMGIGAEQALALSVLLGFALLANGLMGLLPLAFGGEQFAGPPRRRRLDVSRDSVGAP
jgi:uncharacterized membrane protein YbhN (UPF0104 family)